MTRNGKIARLPRSLREQLNRRLEDGAPGVEVAAWLNALPEVQTVLQALFEGRPISEQNVSEWKQGGYVQWQQHQEALDLTRELSRNADELTQLAGGPLSDKVSPLLAARYMVIIKALSAAAGEDPDDWKRLRELCRDLVALRKGDHTAEQLKLDRERLRLGMR